MLFTDSQIEIDTQQISLMNKWLQFFSFLPQGEGCNFLPPIWRVNQYYCESSIKHAAYHQILDMMAKI